MPEGCEFAFLCWKRTQSVTSRPPWGLTGIISTAIRGSLIAQLHTVNPPDVLAEKILFAVHEIRVNSFFGGLPACSLIKGTLTQGQLREKNI